jgi:hypothetical protein
MQTQYPSSTLQVSSVGKLVIWSKSAPPATMRRRSRSRCLLLGYTDSGEQSGARPAGLYSALTLIFEIDYFRKCDSRNYKQQAGERRRISEMDDTATFSSFSYAWEREKRDQVRGAR